MRDALLLLRGHDRDRARAEPLRDLQRRRSNAARGAVHEHGLAVLHAPAQLQREVRGVVVEHQPGALRVVERAEGEREGLRCDGNLGEAAERAERGDAIPRLDRRAVGSRAHDPRDLAAGDERQRRFHLVLAARLQELGERHPRRVHVDENARAGREHVRGLGLVELDELQPGLGP